MKKLFLFLVVLVASLVLVVPAMANGENGNGENGYGGVHHNQVQGAIGTGNVGVQSGGATHHNLIVGGGNNIGTLAGGEVNNTNENTNTNLNLNVNKNKNVNKNTNVAVAVQDQQQKQGQKQSQANQQTVNIEDKREFASGVSVNYPGMVDYRGPDSPQPNVVDMATVLEFKKTFARDEVEAILSSHHGFSSVKMRAHYYTGNKSEKNDGDVVTVIMKKPERAVSIGFINIWATSVNRDTLDVFFRAVKKALDVEQVNTIWVTGEGAMKLVKTLGWGIGLSYSQAFIKGEQSGIGTGGTGISGGEAGNRAKPFVQLQLLYVQ